MFQSGYILARAGQILLGIFVCMCAHSQTHVYVYVYVLYGTIHLQMVLLNLTCKRALFNWLEENKALVYMKDTYNFRHMIETNSNIFQVYLI